jgi:hypothetical protein
MYPQMCPQIYPQIYIPIIQPSQPSLISTDNNRILSIVKEDGKLVYKKSYTCLFGMKCTNKECEDYHHPKVD